MKPVVLFDIDNTIYDSALYREKFFGEIAKILKREKQIENGEELCLKIYDSIRIKTGIFPPEEFVDELARQTGLEEKTKKELLDVIFSQKTLGGNMYEEVIKVLTSLSGSVVLGIFSQGHLELQKAKIKDITQLFNNDHKHIVRDKISEFKKIFERYKNEQIFLVDDALPVIFEVKKHYKNVFVIWIKRGRWALKQKEIEGFKPDEIVENLEEAARIVRAHLDK